MSSIESGKNIQFKNILNQARKIGAGAVLVFAANGPMQGQFDSQSMLRDTPSSLNVNEPKRLEIKEK